jgi:hypothetical protein
MNAYDTLSPADLDAIVRQIAEGGAPVDSWARQAAGGHMRRDDAREYFCHLPSSWSGGNGPRRVARVTVYRDAPGRWTIGDVDVFTHAADSATRDDDAARKILAAVEADPRRITRRDDAAHVAATTDHDFYLYDE